MTSGQIAIQNQMIFKIEKQLREIDQAIYRLVQRLKLKEISADLKGVDEADQANLQIQETKLLREHNRLTKFHMRLTRTLARVKKGEFGSCAECGDSISFKRLLARPCASLCIGCKEDQELGESQTFKVKKF